MKFEGDKVRDYEYDSTSGDLEFVNTFRQFEMSGAYYADYIEKGYTYDTAGRLDVVTYKDFNIDDTSGVASNRTTETYNLTYDDRGFITDEDVTINYGTYSTTNKDFEYDSLGRLKQSIIGSKTTNYTYDRVGNRMTIIEGTNSMVYGYDVKGFNQLMTITKNSQSYASYDYDARGNQKRQDIEVNYGGTTKTQRTDYTYDLMNRMTQALISAPDELTLASLNVYNVGGQRVSRTDGDWDLTTDDANTNGVFDAGEIQNATETNYFYSGSALLYSADNTNDLLTENILDPGGRIIASKRFDTTYGDEYYFFNYDTRNSTSSIIDPIGTLAKGYSYDEFGNQVVTTGTSFNNEVTYTSSIADKSTGLQYMNARFYNPSTGRFLSQDSYSGNAYEPWTQHLYSYTGNNPVNFVDPTGHRRIETAYYDNAGDIVPDPYVPAAVLLPSSGGNSSGGGGGGGNSEAQTNIFQDFDNAAQARADAVFNDFSFKHLLEYLTVGAFMQADESFNDIVYGEGDVKDYLDVGLAVAGAAGTGYSVGKAVFGSTTMLNGGGTSTGPNSVGGYENINKLNHVFNPKHNLDDFVASYPGGQTQALDEIISATQQYVNSNGITGLIQNQIINVNGTNIVVNGNVVEGLFKIGTAWLR